MTTAPATGTRTPTVFGVPVAQLRADLALLAVTAVWGSTFVMVKDALAYAGPFTFLAVRFVLAAAVMLPLLWRGWTWSVLRPGVALGTALFVGYAFQTVGLQFTTPARAAFITGLSVLLVPLFSWLVLRAPVARGVWIGVGLATTGLALLSLGPDVLAGGDILATDTLGGDTVVFGCAIAYAVQILLLGHYAPHHHALALTWTQLTTTAALSVAASLLFEHPRLGQLGPILPAAAFTGLFATVVAFTVQTRAQRYTSPMHAALLFATEPVFGALSSYLLIGEVLGVPGFVGCALILGGTIVAQLTGTVRTPSPKPPSQVIA